MWQATYGWLKDHDALAAWAQGIGTIIAIGVAFYVAQAQIRAAQSVADDDRRRRAKALAFILLPDLRSVKRSIEDDDVQYLTREMLPDEILSRLDQLYILGDAGTHILRAIVACEDEHAQVQRMGLVGRKIKGDFGRGEFRQTAIAEFERALNLLTKLMHS